jgi:hypothetical protein
MNRTKGAKGDQQVTSSPLKLRAEVVKMRIRSVTGCNKGLEPRYQ